MNERLPPARAALAASAAFLAAGSRFVGLTGAGHDEAAHAVVAARWVLPGLRPNEAGWLPWMQSSYMGALKSWFFAPVFAVLGVSLDSMRAVTLGFGAAAAAGAALLAGELYGPEAALAAGLLAAADPALVLGASHDTGPAAFAVAVKLWGLWLCARRRRARRDGRRRPRATEGRTRRGTRRSATCPRRPGRTGRPRGRA
ncbi:MAG: glycosyltransferase family 39 protein, partial [Elusimicrobia bacterium]|nr:glycosyltransferase family 39 protein [Elusimicrobiota bacterium]